MFQVSLPFHTASSEASASGIRQLLGRATGMAGSRWRLSGGWSAFSGASSTGGELGDWQDSPPDSLVLEMVQFGQRRQALAEHIAMELLQRPDLREAPGTVQDFLLEVWPLVLAQARLSCPDDIQDPGGYLDTATRLLWSVRRDAALRRPGKVLELIPKLLEQLRSGISLLGRHPGEFEGFFRALEVLHLPALQLCAKRRRVDLSLPPPPAEPPQPSPAELLAQLQPGVCIDLYCGRRWRQARLDWVDARGRQFMFIGEGGQSHAMTRRILVRLLRERLVRILAPLPPTGGPRFC
ncbi:DUF1631 family protein [Ramlibacter sp. AW1]|uniref:DUF1631 family protein n=1 Tax=Ramlibacter aurantiacus TaxID=2801330 RepID=A0A936ZPY8_9BURK|nr:DUF1631 family protein [Ramlibacter aurantiacus]MBL0421405.1 DUF1631 family protein [Ramlibacter aurantiacus]